MSPEPLRHSSQLTLLLTGLIPMLATAVALAVAGADKPEPLIPRVVSLPPDRVSFETSDGQVLLQYQRQPVKDSKLPVDSAGYFHPLTSPSGIVMTDFAPPDH